MGCLLVSVDYCLPPEVPHPGLVLDCYAALKWLYDNGRSWEWTRNGLLLQVRAPEAGSRRPLLFWHVIAARRLWCTWLTGLSSLISHFSAIRISGVTGQCGRTTAHNIARLVQEPSVTIRHSSACRRA